MSYPAQEISGRSLYPSPTAASLPGRPSQLSPTPPCCPTDSVRSLDPAAGLFDGAVTLRRAFGYGRAAVEGSVVSLFKRLTPLKGAPQAYILGLFAGDNFWPEIRGGGRRGGKRNHDNAAGRRPVRWANE